MYSKESYDQMMTLSYEDLFLYQTAMWYIKMEQTLEAAAIVENLRVKAELHPNPVLKLLMRYLHIEIGLDRKFVDPYLK